MSERQRSIISPVGKPAAPSREIAERLVHVSNLAQSNGYAHGLKPSQWTALRYFVNASPDQRTVSSFAAHHATTRGAASQMVEVLVVKGLLERVPVPTDRRMVRLEPTGKAFDLLSRDPLAAFVGVVDRLPSDLREAMAEGLERMLRQLQPPDREEPPVTGKPRPPAI